MKPAPNPRRAALYAEVARQAQDGPAYPYTLRVTERGYEIAKRLKERTGLSMCGLMTLALVNLAHDLEEMKL